MRKVQILAIPLLVVLVLLIGMGAGACGGGVDGETPPPPGDENGAPPPGDEEEAAPPAALPKPGEWTASTGASEFTFTFNVRSDSTSIESVRYELAVYAGVLKGIVVPRLPIIGGQFTFDTETWAPWRVGPSKDWDMVIQGRFDETGTHASGTWEISSEGTILAAGTWESSR